jgi:hypothetical protein
MHFSVTLEARFLATEGSKNRIIKMLRRLACCAARQAGERRLSMTFLSISRTLVA